MNFDRAAVRRVVGRRTALVATLLVLAAGCSGSTPTRDARGTARGGTLVPAPRVQMATSPELAALERDLRARIARDTAGEVAVALIDLRTNRRLGINHDVSMHAASTMKVPVLLELYRQADLGRHSVHDSITVINTFTSIADTSRYTLASDGRTNLIARLGTQMPLREIAHWMITVSSNLATNILIDYLRADSVQRLMASLGAQDMVVLRGVSDNPAFAAGMNNTTTAAALARVMEVIARCEVHSRAACDDMMQILTEQQFRSEIPAGVPAGTRVGNKTGSITRIRHDAAIVVPPGREPYVLVVLTRGAASSQAATAVAVDISRRVWEELAR